MLQTPWPPVRRQATPPGGLLSGLKKYLGGVSFENCYRVILFLEMGQLSGLESEKLFEIVGLMPGLDINSI